jgi:hypothetical protein
MDLSKAKCVGKLNGEPVYELSGVDMPHAASNYHHRDSSRFENCGMPECLTCILNQLIEPAEDLEHYVQIISDHIRSFDVAQAGLPKDETKLQARRVLLRRIALASQVLAHVKGSIITAAKFFEDEELL